MKLLKRAFLSTVPVLTGYVILGIGFGLLLGQAGFGIGWSLGMSVFIYAGSMQYVGIELLRSGASFAAVALTTLTVNARHLFYGISMVDRYRDAGAVKPYLIFGLTDETYSLVCAEPPADVPENRRVRYCVLVTLLDHVYWVTGSVLGALLGAVIPFSLDGLDFALTALFITVCTDQWLHTKKHLPALTGLGASLICLLIFGKDSFLIPAMAVIAVLLLVLPHDKMQESPEGGDAA